MIGENIINKGAFTSINLCWQSDNWEKKIRHHCIKELKRFIMCSDIEEVKIKITSNKNFKIFVNKIGPIHARVSVDHTNNVIGFLFIDNFNKEGFQFF